MYGKEFHQQPTSEKSERILEVSSPSSCVWGSRPFLLPQLSDTVGSGSKTKRHLIISRDLGFFLSFASSQKATL
ncbi:hypothetical protein GRJ2_001984600 [Grus japonensis]|uniref:Uncharacterized protein n=1 Tax=Grus japonensis TaxID=30415 RepID=A0ABC9XBY7_GRUJA